MSDHSHEISDGAIVADVLAGRRERFALIAQRYHRPLMSVAVSRLGQRQWAEDVVQESLLCALKSIHTYDSRYSFRTWLWTILLNQCRRHVQRRSRRPLVRTWSDAEHADPAQASMCSALESGDAAPLPRLLADERRQRLEELLATLPEPQADALRLRFYGELKFQEIADAMQCSLSTAKNRVRWGLEKLSQLLVAGETP